MSVSGINLSNSTGGNGGISINSGATLVFNDGGSYQHNHNGDNIPTATWNVNSNCIITGVTGTMPGGISQTFGNLKYNCSGQTSSESFPVTSVAGNLEISKAQVPGK